LSKPSHSSITPLGVVLAGGQSRRMGGKDKFLKPHKGTNLLTQVLKCISPQLETIIISSNTPAKTIREHLPTAEAFSSIPIIADKIQDYAGPLAGLHSAMLWAKDKAPKTTHLISVAADTPFFPSDFAKKMMQHNETQPAHSIILAQSHGYQHPIFGLWPLHHLENLETALLSGVRKIRAWSEQHPHCALNFDDETINGQTIDPFFNVNKPEDFEHFTQLLQT